jgi:hypothetical protein
MFGKWPWRAYEAARISWGTTLRLVVLMAAAFIFSGSLVGVILVMIDHQTALLKVCHHSPDTVRHWQGAWC